jgi:hypothetical protein
MIQADRATKNAKALAMITGKVRNVTNRGDLILAHDEPASMPGSPTIRLKGIKQIEDLHFTRSGGQITWLRPISPDATVEVYDGASLVWQWSAARGDIVGS